MKALIQRKTAGLLALMMAMSLLLPIVSYAAGFRDVTSNNGNVTGTVYIPKSVYDANQDARNVIIHVYAPNGDFLGTVDGVYRGVYQGVYNNSITDVVYYDFSVSSAAYINYSSLQFKYFYPGATTADAVYGPIDRNYPVVPPIFGGIGGGVTTPTDGVVKANPDGTVDANALKKALESGSAIVEITGEVAKLPASALTGGGVVTIVSPLGSYELPLDELDLEALAEELGVSIDDLWIVVTIAEPEGAAKAAAEAAIESAGGEAVSAIVDFKLEAVAGDKSVEINKFSKFVKRTLNLTGEGDNLVAVRIKGNSVNPIPTKVGEEDAAFFSNSNSIYAIIDVAPKSFSDLRNHWGVKDIHTLANKLIVNGTGAGKFEPKRDVTRAEFAAMIVRALGLQASGEAGFSDVASSAWYAEAVAAAAEAGIVKGDGTGKFRPTDKITRQELAAMVVRAQELAGVEIDLSNAEVAAVLTGFKDAGQIGSWARAELAAAIESGVVAGTTANTVSPNATATRAEAAVMIIRLLNNADFI
ncbi:putative S-layer protein [Thermobacillus composti KWC4]|uniref:Putative S-layer protein n=1 Tax=Thermobacillus composti (strain DSM 18247 / JCM 13945 / KWC4) TaxID=717605 RepID=L0EJJ1_THECK|nr:S-layer homology domain-containing protein [Thermobacillus composti]AGA59926.1 putative S-layer protein [Thermobacillus composti KWC4]